MRIKVYLTQQQYEALYQSSQWRIVELDLNVIRTTPGVQRKTDLFGAFASGDASATRFLNGREAILGMDVIVYELHPKFRQGEWYINAYHYIVRRTGDPTLPFLLEGPFTKEALIEHWAKSLDLSAYN